MSKVVIVGDCHFSPKIPVSRKDNYPETLLNKLDSLFKYCKENNVSDCIFLGDLINANQMNMEYFIRLFRAFLVFFENKITLHLCIGNHDLQHGNQEFLDKSPISLLLDSNLMLNKDFIKDNIYFKIVNYYTPLTMVEKAHPGMFNIFIGHLFYLNGFNDMDHTLTAQKCKELGYNIYFLGHDHTPYEPLKVNGYEVHRPGSFSRATSDTCQVGRDNIQICVLDTKTYKVDYVNLPGVLLSKDIYKESKLLTKINESEATITLTEEIDNLINDLNFNFSSDIYKVVDGMDLEPDIKEKVTEYLEKEGMFR